MKQLFPRIENRQKIAHQIVFHQYLFLYLHPHLINLGSVLVVNQEDFMSSIQEQPLQTLPTMSSSADNGQTRNGKKKKKKGKVGKVFPMHPVIIQTGSDQEELLKRSGKGHKDLLETTHKRNSAANFITNYQLVKKGVDKFKDLKCGRRSRNGGSTGMLHL